MNEWLKKVMDKFKELWSKWKPIQKVILFGIIIVIIVAIIAGFFIWLQIKRNGSKNGSKQLKNTSKV